MAVRIRLKRLGRRNQPMYRIAVADARTPRDGRTIEDIGSYNPLEKDAAQKVRLDADRVRYWLSVGAQPSEAVAALLKQQGLPAIAGKGASKKKSAKKAKGTSSKASAKASEKVE